MNKFLPNKRLDLNPHKNACSKHLTRPFSPHNNTLNELTSFSLFER